MLPMGDFQKRNKLALITGATGGIGLSFATQLAAEGYDLVITNRNRQKLDKIAAELKENNSGINIEVIVADLSVPGDIARLVRRIKQMEHIDMLVNCAGYGQRCPFYQEEEHEILDMLSVHVTAIVQLVHAALPLMINQQGGAIIAVSSLAAFLPAPDSSIYASSKAFLNTFIESLHMEVRQHGIKLQSLCPGPTHTDFHKGTDMAKSVSGIDLWMEPDEVVDISLKALKNGEVICVPGSINKVIKNIAPVLPRRSYYRLTEKFAKKYRQEGSNRTLPDSHGEPA